jgi:hypothetical protein
MRHGAHHLIQRTVGVLLAAGLFVSSGGPALAGDTCSGTYSTSLLQQVPLPVTIALAEPPVNPDLAKLFLAGIRAGGAQVDPSAKLRLNLVFTIATATSGPLQGSVYNNFSWADEGGASLDLTASTVNVMAQLVDTTTYAFIWIANAQCTLKVRDGTALAGEIGALIGRTLGRDIPNGKF